MEKTGDREITIVAKGPVVDGIARYTASAKGHWQNQTLVAFANDSLADNKAFQGTNSAPGALLPFNRSAPACSGIIFHGLGSHKTKIVHAWCRSSFCGLPAPGPPPPGPPPPTPHHDTDCTDQPNNADIPPAKRHFISVYSSLDLHTWQAHGAVFNPIIPEGVLYRPHVLYNAVTRKFVMWYKVHGGTNRPGHSYGVAVADHFTGPFEVEVDIADVKGDVSDQTLFQDDDGQAYLVHTGNIDRLNENFTNVRGGANNTQKVPRPSGWEGSVMFKRSHAGVNRYYILGGHYCCACKGGSNAYVFMAQGSPLGKYSYVVDIGVNTSDSGGQNRQHSPYRWTTHAQTSSAFIIPFVSDRNESSTQVVVLGNQWVTATAADAYARNKDLLYWALLSFNESTGVPMPLVHQTEVDVNV